MPDIAMCANKHCPSRSSCYRQVATPSEFWQSYGNFSPPEGAEKCNWHWPIEDEKYEY